MTDAELTRLLGVLVAELSRRAAPDIAEHVVERLRAGSMPGYVDQTQSPLGRRRHIQFVRAGGGVQVGRRYLARVEDVQQHARELAEREAARPKKPRKAATQPTPANDGDRELDAVAERLGYRRAK